MELIPNVREYIDSGAVALLITLLIGGLVTVVRGLLVPKNIYEREVKRADALEDTLKETSTALLDLTNAVKETKRVEEAVNRLADELRRRR